jgi:hypothetical protein
MGLQDPCRIRVLSSIVDELKGMVSVVVVDAMLAGSGVLRPAFEAERGSEKLGGAVRNARQGVAALEPPIDLDTCKKMS